MITPADRHAIEQLLGDMPQPFLMNHMPAETLALLHREQQKTNYLLALVAVRLRDDIRG